MSETPEERANAAAFRTIIERIINDGEVELCSELMDQDMKIHRYGLASTAAALSEGRPPQLDAGSTDMIESFKRGLTMLRSAFPDWSHEIVQLLASDDWVAGRWQLRCTHTGSFMGIPPTGRSVAMDESGMIRFKNGKMIEGWFLGDELGLLRQLGADVSFPGANAE